ncbi:hypothetical protein RclHR1_08980003 [Rhizophagus clarus]|uniref:Protein kinase domain-containing protein n=1 Tax=Rhizophagus clarus TaxID=94130 RepID=A0A2Z6S8X4_9GLOM|nr:hypothetical protein RclHR1_08980003 [Rhizophagus clarus]
MQAYCISFDYIQYVYSLTIYKMDSHISKVKALCKGYTISKVLNKVSENGNCKECGNLNSFSDDWSTWYFLSESKEYVIVLKYYTCRDLKKYLTENFSDLTWLKCLDHLYDIAYGLNTIYSEELMHRDIHSGNLLIDVNYEAIRDLELCCSADSSVPKNSIYGFQPFSNIPHDLNSALKICDGIRPEIVKETSKCYKELMQKCWHNDLNEKPNIANIIRKIEKWLNGIFEGDNA